jgi:hypothetical protein
LASDRLALGRKQQRRARFWLAWAGWGATLAFPVFFGILPSLPSYGTTFELSVRGFTILSLVSTALSIWMSNWMGMAFTGIFPEMATDAAEYETEVSSVLIVSVFVSQNVESRRYYFHCEFPLSILENSCFTPLTIFAYFRLPFRQCLEAVRDTLDDLAYYLLRRARATSAAAAASSSTSAGLVNNQLASGCKSPLASGMSASPSGPRTPSGSVDGGRIADSSSHAIDSAARELALRCAHNVARSARALSARFVHVSAARVDRAFALFAAAARSGTRPDGSQHLH